MSKEKKTGNPLTIKEVTAELPILYEKVERVLRSLTRDWETELCEDVLQETLITFIKKVEGGTLVTENMISYVQGIARNKLLKALEQKQRRRQNELIVEGDSDILLNKEDKIDFSGVNEENVFVICAQNLGTEERLTLAVREILNDIDPELAEIVRLKYFDNLTIEKIAERKERSVRTINRRLDEAKNSVMGKLRRLGLVLLLIEFEKDLIDDGQTIDGLLAKTLETFPPIDKPSPHAIKASQRIYREYRLQGGGTGLNKIFLRNIGLSAGLGLGVILTVLLIGNDKEEPKLPVKMKLELTQPVTKKKTRPKVRTKPVKIQIRKGGTVIFKGTTSKGALEACLSGAKSFTVTDSITGVPTHINCNIDYEIVK